MPGYYANTYGFHGADGVYRIYTFVRGAYQVYEVPVSAMPPPHENEPIDEADASDDDDDTSSSASDTIPDLVDPTAEEDPIAV